MSSTTRIRQRYDHRLRDLVRSAGDIGYATRRGVPRSTAHGWLTSTRATVVTLDVADRDFITLHNELLVLRQRVEKLVALLRLMAVLLRVTGVSLNNTRVSDGSSKAALLRAIERSRSILPLRTALRVLRLSRSRYHSWKREKECGLDDMPSCPRLSPQQLTHAEVETIREMVTSDEYRHVPTATLAVLAQRIGRVFASPTTWFRLVRRYKWRRPRLRVHPAKPKLGIRASSPNEIWHVDTTVIRLLDGTRAYVHAVIDNFSRRILAWRVCSTFNPGITDELLLVGVSGLVDTRPTLLVDGGVENFNSCPSRLFRTPCQQRTYELTPSVPRVWFWGLKRPQLGGQNELIQSDLAVDPGHVSQLDGSGGREPRTTTAACHSETEDQAPEAAAA